MAKPIVIFAVMFAIAVLWWRSALFEHPHISPSDHHGVRGSVSGVLPPSGYLPGHLLRDTLKNDGQHAPPYMDIGRYAYRQYLAAPKEHRQRVRRNLQSIVLPAAQWITSIEAQRLDFLCIGESHQDNYRQYLASQFFANYPLDILFLEARLLPAKFMLMRTDVGERDVALLNADIAAIIRAAETLNPAIEIIGIEESSGQLSDRRDAGAGSRDQSLLDNLTANYQAGRRSAALLGALHCTERWNWLFARLERSKAATDIESALNMRLMSERKDLLSREFSRFLSLLGYPPDDYAIVNTDVIDDAVHDWFLQLTQNFASYRAIILFRDGEVAVQ